MLLFVANVVAKMIVDELLPLLKTDGALLLMIEFVIGEAQVIGNRPGEQT
jgi:hypothetical protein